MKIRAIRLHHVGRFVEPTAIEGLTGRLDVLAEDNEFGKSTVFRAIEAVFQSKHTMTGKALDALRPYGGGEPLIEADFEVEGRQYRIRKQFGRGKAAELSDLAARRTLARGADADDQLAQVLGIADGKPSRFGLLWVGQQRSLERADPDTDAATGIFKDRGERTALQSAIEREIETVTSGPEVREIRSRVAMRLLPFTGGRQGQPKTGSELDLALKNRDQLAAALEAARRTEAELVARVDRLERLVAERAARYSDAALGDLERKSAAARAALEAARDARARLDRAETMRAKAGSAVASAAAQLAEFDRKLTELAGLDAELANAKPRSDLLEREAATAAQQVDDATKGWAGIDAETRALQSSVAAHAQYERRQDAAARLERLSRDLGAARKLEADIAASEKILRSNRLTAEAVAEIETADARVSRLADKLSAAAPSIEIDLLPTASSRVRVGGKPLTSGGLYHALDPLRIEIDGVGTITVAPGAGSDRIETERRLSEARKELSMLLDAAGVDGFDRAIEMRRDRVAHEQALAFARSSLANIAARGVAALADDARTVEALLAGLPAGAPLPVPAAIESRLAELETERRAAEVRVSDARRVDQEARSALLTHRAALAARMDRRQDLDAQLPPTAVREATRAGLHVTLTDAERSLNEIVREVAAFAEAAPSEARLSELREDSDAAASALKAAERRAKELAVEIGGVEGELKSAGDLGSANGVAACEGELARAEATLARLEATKRGLILLDRTLSGAERQLQDRFLHPVMERLRPYLADLFPGSEVRFHDGFKAETLVRGGVPEPFDVLSDGTREQLAVLVRLAFGRLWADAGSPAPMILDDALVYSDDRRIGQMFKALEAAAGHHQVLVLTCRSELFSRLGGNRVQSSGWSP